MVAAALVSSEARNNSSRSSGPETTTLRPEPAATSSSVSTVTGPSYQLVVTPLICCGAPLMIVVHVG